MGKLALTEQDKIWLEENYPDLYLSPNEPFIRGELCFRMNYSGKKSGYVINPDSSYRRKDGTLIQDVYEIEIDLSTAIFLPAVRETGGRIQKSTDRWNLGSLRGLHVNSDGTCCLCAKIEERARLPNGFNLKDFFENLLIPFFYYQSFFEKYGKEPWASYSHGDLGLLESYFKNQKASSEIIRLSVNSLSEHLRNLILQNTRLKGYHLCICGSKRKFRKCHRDALFGYNKLRKDCQKIRGC